MGKGKLKAKNWGDTFQKTKSVIHAYNFPVSIFFSKKYKSENK